MVLRVSREQGRIGIPRALHFFYHPALWEPFFESLGFEPVLSEPTSRRTVERAGRLAETEHCLPVKLFHAHLDELVGQVDKVFVPRVLSTHKNHVACPKLGALPDVAAIEFPVEILTVDIDERRESLEKTMVKLAKMLGAGRRAARSAASEALKSARNVRKLETSTDNSHERFLILGHPYTLHDRYISGRIFTTLRRLDVIPEAVSFDEGEPPDSFVKWDTLNCMYHELQSLNPERYAGVVQISAFNCGCDSMVVDMFRSAAREKGVPYTILMFDEHTSLGGVDTRLEAFVDSIRWKS
jgi:predicted nucleotide-binding protein (sugar kinase/HSP70/actin superfamily)